MAEKMTDEQLIGAFEHLIQMHSDKEIVLSVVDKVILDGDDIDEQK